MQLLQNKTALITGGSRGIGKEIAILFAQQGANIAFTASKDSKEARETEKQLQAMGVDAKFYCSNASSFQDSQTTVEKVIADFQAIDILVNNAGIASDNLLLRMTESEWDNVIEVNLKSVFNLTKAILPFMLKQRSGSIISIASIVGLEGNPGQSNYAAAKAGIIGFTKSIAKELGSRNIRCNVIAPGFIETEMTAHLDEEVIQAWTKSIPLRRSGKPKDVAQTALFLASEMSEYITGQIISCDGGMNM